MTSSHTWNGQQTTGIRAVHPQSVAVLLIPEVFGTPMTTTEKRWSFADTALGPIHIVSASLAKEVQDHWRPNPNWQCINCSESHRSRYLSCPSLQDSQEAMKNIFKKSYKVPIWQYEASTCLTKTNKHQIQNPKFKNWGDKSIKHHWRNKNCSKLTQGQPSAFWRKLKPV